MSHQAITRHLLALADSNIAEHSQRFFKTGVGEYGYGDRFLGIRVPVIRQAVKKYNTISLKDIQRLLESEFHEIRLFSLLVLVLQFSRADIAVDSDKKQKLYELYLKNTQYINSWDLVDLSAHHIVGKYLYHKDRSLLYVLTKSSSLWERRIAIISCFHFIRKNDFNDALNIARQLLHDQEDLIHKATGWMLREIGKRDKSREIEFLNRHYKDMPRTMLRYAIEKFSEQERQDYLKGRI